VFGAGVVGIGRVGVLDVFREGVVEDLLAEFGREEPVVEEGGELRVVGFELE
jgi:hypothetical protein